MENGSFDYPIPFTGSNFFLVGSTTPVTIGGTGSSDLTVPSTPTNVSISSIGATSLTLSFTCSTDNIGITGYNIYANGSTTPIWYNDSTQSSGTINASITGLLQNTSYYFTVKARDAAGNFSVGANSATITTNTSSDTIAPTAPTSASASNVSFATLTLNWIASTDNVGVTNYLVYKNGVLLATLGNVITYDVTGLTASTAYAFTIYAKDAAGNTSNVSNTVNVSTIAGSGDTTPPSMPTDLWTQAFGDYLEIYWTASTDNIGVVGYDLEFSYSPTGPWNNLGSTTDSFFGFLGFYDTYYYIRVKANDNSGNTSGWAEIGSWTETDPNNAPY
jgi:chitodextrinase